MKHVGNIQPFYGSTHSKKRVGRGPGSGHGGTSTRGHKGHQSRSGFNQLRGFEGGQMSLTRRIPKFGFKNPFRKEYQVVNLATLQLLVDAGKIEGVVSPEVLYNLGVIADPVSVKILGEGDLTARLNVTATKFTSSAKEKIEKAGGTVISHE